MIGTHNLPVEGVELKPHRKPDYVVKMEARIAELEAENATLCESLRLAKWDAMQLRRRLDAVVHDKPGYPDKR